jgi:hypothetical protein
MSSNVATPLLDQIEPDDAGESLPAGNITSAKPASARAPVVLTPGSRADASVGSASDAEAGASCYTHSAAVFT